MPGTIGLILISAGVALAIVAIAVRWRRRPPVWFPRMDRRLALIVALALAAPVGEAAVSLVGNDIFGTRNLAVSWPAFALILAVLVSAGRYPFRIASVVLLVAGFGIGAARMLEPKHQRPDYKAAAAFVDSHSSPRDVVIDASVLSPGPFAGLDVALDRSLPVIRAGAPRNETTRSGISTRFFLGKGRENGGKANGRRVFLVSLRTGVPLVPGRPAYSQVARVLAAKLAPGYRHVVTRSYPGILPIGCRCTRRANR